METHVDDITRVVQLALLAVSGGTQDSLSVTAQSRGSILGIFDWFARSGSRFRAVGGAE